MDTHLSPNRPLESINVFPIFIFPDITSSILLVPEPVTINVR